ncbi:hypothetical protein KTH_63160 [Thermosporothrix hazakensis]|nr:hypothetical protein KTH_63160 [Thermosporothrix hazakensis]
MNRDMQVFHGGVRREIFPEEVNQLVSGKQFPLIQNQPLQEQLGLTPAPAVLYDRSVIAKHPELSEQVGSIE